jgi:GNAT superfamily N-acetyltransferase
VITILEIDENRLPEWVATMKAADDWTGTVEDYVDWRRQARHGTWFLASEDGRNVGAAFGIGGWHEPPGVARGEVRVIADARGRGTGSALLERLGAWAAGLGYGELLGEVRETDWRTSRRRGSSHPRASRSSPGPSGPTSRPECTPSRARRTRTSPAARTR